MSEDKDKIIEQLQEKLRKKDVEILEMGTELNRTEMLLPEVTNPNRVGEVAAEFGRRVEERLRTHGSRTVLDINCSTNSIIASGLIIGAFADILQQMGDCSSKAAKRGQLFRDCYIIFYNLHPQNAVTIKQVMTSIKCYTPIHMQRRKPYTQWVIAGDVSDVKKEAWQILNRYKRIKSHELAELANKEFPAHLFKNGETFDKADASAWLSDMYYTRLVARTGNRKRSYVYQPIIPKG